MKWNGELLKSVCEDRGLPILKLADRLEVSRQTVHSWLTGQVPKGHHLLKLCRILEVDPASLFVAEASSVSVPVHRVRAKAKVTEDRSRVSHELAEGFAPLFRDARRAEVLPVIRTSGYDAGSIRETARKLRQLADIPEGKPCTYEHVFRLLARLSCYVVFMPFPDAVKSYAFYSSVHGHRTVFVNRSSNVLDLVFFLLHEAVHAAFDEQKEVSLELEDFCDAVAGQVQFPSEYIQFVKGLLAGLDEPQQMLIVKKCAVENGHALYGLAKTLFPEDKEKLRLAGKSDSSLRKRFPTLDTLFFHTGESSGFLARYRLLSPLFCRLIEEQAGSFSARRIGELMGLDSELDASQVKEQLAKGREV
jgi:transcriptional regulator with XRE-family HTH domain